MKTRTRSSWMRTLGNFAYLLGVAFLIAAMAVNALPARTALAATVGTLNCPLPSYNSTHYALQPGQTVTCTITGASFSGSPAHLDVIIQSSVLGNQTVQGDVSGHTITFSYTGRGNGCDTSVVRYSNNNGGTNRPAGVQGFGYVDSGGNHIICGGATNTPPANTSTPTNTATTPANTSTPTNTATTPANTSTPTNTPTNTPTDTPTDTPEPTQTPGGPTPTVTNTPTDTPTNTPTTTAHPGPNHPSIDTVLSATQIILGQSVHDTATLSNATSDAGGTVTYTVYSDDQCTVNFADAGTVNVTNAIVPNSNDVTFNQVGVFYWQASYSGDANNDPALDECQAEVVTVSSGQGPTATPRPQQPLIPVTGAALGGGWSSQTIFFNLGIGFLGLGLVLNGLARSRKELEI